MILRVPECVDAVLNDLQINKVCKMLYDVATCIGTFYRANKVLGSPEEASRILLLEATRKCMKALFNMLGMKTLDRL